MPMATLQSKVPFFRWLWDCELHRFGKALVQAPRHRKLRIRANVLVVLVQRPWLRRRSGLSPLLGPLRSFLRLISGHVGILLLTAQRMSTGPTQHEEVMLLTTSTGPQAFTKRLEDVAASCDTAFTARRRRARGASRSHLPSCSQNGNGMGQDVTSTSTCHKLKWLCQKDTYDQCRRSHSDLKGITRSDTVRDEGFAISEWRLAWPEDLETKMSRLLSVNAQSQFHELEAQILARRTRKREGTHLHSPFSA